VRSDNPFHPLNPFSNPLSALRLCVESFLSLAPEQEGGQDCRRRDPHPLEVAGAAGTGAGGGAVGFVFHVENLVRVFARAVDAVDALALALGTMVFGAVVAEVVFSYPGLGSTILTASLGQDYPLLSATTLIISIMVLVANFSIEIIYGFLDPRIKAAQAD